jgi:uncharacterized protein (DUF697 family)
MVTRRAGLSAGAALVPLPGADIAADVGILMELFDTINRRFGLSPDQIARLDPSSRERLVVLLARIGGAFAGNVITRQLVLQLLKRLGTRVVGKSLVRFIPLAGQAAAAGVSFALLRNVGRAHVDDCYRVAREALLAAGEPMLLPG